MNWFQWVQLITAIVTQLPVIIKTTEAAFGPKTGPTKLDNVVGAAAGIATIAGATAAQVATLTQGVTPLINAQVAAMNQTGQLPKP